MVVRHFVSSLFPVALVAMIASSAVSGQPPQAPSPLGRQTAREFHADVTRSIATKYLLYVPAGRGTSEGPLPVVVYLHGGSLRGDDVEKLRTVGLPHRLETEASFPFVVIAPLCPAGEIWTDADAVVGVLDEVLSEYPADR
jgi:predicted peptidase